MADLKIRLKKLKRMLEVQKQLRQLHEWKVSDTQVKKNKVIEDKDTLVSALNHFHSNGALLSDLIGRKLTAVSKKGLALDVIYSSQSKVLQGQQRKVVQIERAFIDAKNVSMAEEAKQDLLEVIEISLMKKS